jgi:hypothetical protein
VITGGALIPNIWQWQVLSLSFGIFCTARRKLHLIIQLFVPFGVAINLVVANVPHFGKLSGGTISSIFELMLLKSLFLDCHPNPAPSIK